MSLHEAFRLMHMSSYVFTEAQCCQAVILRSLFTGAWEYPMISCFEFMCDLILRSSVLFVVTLEWSRRSQNDRKASHLPFDLCSLGTI